MRSFEIKGKCKLSYWNQKDASIEHKTIVGNIPGNVELDLVENGILPDLYFASNVKLLKDYEAYAWRYEIEFDAEKPLDGERVFLNFDGVDCIAEYFLNDEKIGESKNALIAHKFDVTDTLNYGKNKLEVEISSPIVYAEGLDYTAFEWAYAINYEALRVRKAPHTYGWDIMPRAFSTGIWRSVTLQYEEENEIRDLYIQTKGMECGNAVLFAVFDLKINRPNYDDLYLKIVASVKGKVEFEYIHRVRFCRGNIRIEVENPKLWWPNGYGEPNIYDTHVELLYKDTVLAQKDIYFGIRTAKLVKSEIVDFYQGEFAFYINGVKVMCKGSNWLPIDAFHSRDKDRYQKILSYVSELNCNILRMWGGNVYEDHEFFEYCDRHGIMIWHDFSFSCAFYPLEDEFYKEVKDEVRCVVRKLRIHPSIILWAGDNEIDAHMGAVAGFDANENTISRKIIPSVVKSEDPFREYLPSSPYTSPEAYKKGFSLQRELTPIERKWTVSEPYKVCLPEDHPWGPREYFKSDFYKRLNCCFMSEIGFYGCPNISSLKSFIREEQLWPINENEDWYTHITAYEGKDFIYGHQIETMERDIMEFFSYLPDNLEDFVLASQIFHAEAFKYMIESTRNEKWKKTGVIWWNIIDGWQTINNGIMNWDYSKKLAFYYIKRSQQDVVVTLSGPDHYSTKMFICNDTLENKNVKYRVWDADTNEIMAEGSYEIKANLTDVVDEFRAYHGQQRLFLMEWTVDGKRFVNHYLMGTPPFDLNRYKNWLIKIANLDNSFDGEKVGY